MAGMTPFFLTGANAKIRINNVTLAFCTDVAYSVVVNHATPQLLGMYEGSSVEPLSYRVSGSFTVIKYTADASTDISGNSPDGVSERGNGVGSFTKSMNPFQAVLNGLDLKNGPDARTNDSLNPKKLDNASSFTIDIYQKLAKGSRPEKEQDLLDKITLAGNSAVDALPVAKIRNCRITQMDFKLTKKNVAIETFQFVALYVDEDTFRADFSGVGQHFA